MSFQRKYVLIAGLIWLIPLFINRPLLLAFAKGDDLVQLTILYTGDEYGYLEPCG
jgi:hypothetical protein